MAIEYQQNQAVLRDVVSVDDAEGLLAWLQNKPAAQISLMDCTHLHPANLQVLLAARVNAVVWPEDVSLRGWLEPILSTY